MSSLRGFVNACRHRGNVLCTAATGNARRGFLCQYHLWSYDLEGKLRGMLRGRTSPARSTRARTSLLQVSVDTFGGFIFLNPDPEAAPCASSSARRSSDLLAPYNIDEMLHRHGCPRAIGVQLESRHGRLRGGLPHQRHPSAIAAGARDRPADRPVPVLRQRTASPMAPFEVRGRRALENQVEGIMELPETFP